MTEQYWADGATQNCLWCFQVQVREFIEPMKLLGTAVSLRKYLLEIIPNIEEARE